MLFTTLATVAATITLASAHFKVDYPTWRGDSFGAGRSQWDFPCAGVPETNLTSNRTQWPPGGSLKFFPSHHWALTYINVGIGTNVSSFNISLLNSFNQTGNGTFCLKETAKSALEAGLAKAGLTIQSIEGKQASLQVVQIASSGASLFNCMDITFNSSAALLSDEQCTNSTGVGGIAVVNADTIKVKEGAASGLKPALGVVILAGLVAIAIV
ncbi:hypothetical protein P154DRAFT_555822 [Amniculicola lignicola CBS 123094]|uniref:Copper acquisition factor BIM1-like domain-containing protein n=1 Tax=Amniculicola lignicola CBS 123094 TaxID=1392246 RepID=A0A6A5WHX5_9PLEO|nr:hypothetical protein P154DRAFT_555822 [Amniculicola lignicola CBS 123094]